MPQGKHILGRSPTRRVFGTAKVGDRGQIVIPKAARDKFGLTNGSRLIVVSDEVGIAMLPAEAFEEHLRQVLLMAQNRAES